MLTRTANSQDIEGILRLQAVNLYSNLSEPQREAQGFVTTPFTPEQIQILIDQTGAFVAVQADQVVGYAFAGSWAFFSQWPIFPHMVSLLPSLEFAGQQITDSNSFQYGPVCIDQALRGSDAFPQLFATMRSGMRDRYPLGVTFINQKNPRSFAAHNRKLGLAVITEFEFNHNSYYMLAFPT
jgi:hypothetical protein